SASVPVLVSSSSVPVSVSSSSASSSASVSSSSAQVSSSSSVTSKAKGKVPGLPANLKGAITRARSALLKSAAGKIAAPSSQPASSSSGSNDKNTGKASTGVSTVAARPAADNAPRKNQVPGIPANVKGAITRSRAARSASAARKIVASPSRSTSYSTLDKGKGKATTQVSPTTAQSSNTASPRPTAPSASTALRSQLDRSSAGQTASSVASSSRHTLDMPPPGSGLLPNEKDAEELDEKDAEELDEKDAEELDEKDAEESDEEDPSLASDAEPDYLRLALESHTYGPYSRFLATVRPPGSILKRRTRSAKKCVVWGSTSEATFSQDDAATEIDRH
ncbi:hypothetical protein CF327_g7795, partial [Tilletia walkeri]